MGRVGLKRLLGAGVVAALAVIVLPFILQGEGYKAALRTEIPARPEPPEPLDTAEVEPPAEVRELLTPPPPLPAPELPAEAPAAPTAQDLLTPSPEGTAGEASTPPPAQPAKAAGLPPEQQTVGQSAGQSAGQWVVQLGSFGVEANARQLQDQVQGAGIPCQIEVLEIEGRRMWRVRAGPFATQAEAEAALQRLQGGFKLGGMVIPLR